MSFFKKAAKYSMDVEVLIHAESNLYKSHGLLCVDHKDLGFENKAVRFCFKGVTNPPAMTPAILGYIFDAAADKGYVVHELLRYGNCVIMTEDESFLTAIGNGFKGGADEWKRIANTPAPKQEPQSVSRMPGFPAKIS